MKATAVYYSTYRLYIKLDFRAVARIINGAMHAYV